MFHSKDPKSYPETNRRLLSKIFSIRAVLLSSLILVLVSLFFGCGGTEYPKCDNDDDCHAGEYCVNGTCQMCRDTTDCPNGHECTNGRCEPIDNYCQTSADCGAGEECQNNRCVTAEQPLAPAENKQTSSNCVLRPIYFDFDSSNIKTGGRDTLVEDADCIREKSYGKLDVTGYCDPRGTEEYNLALGDRRARSTKKYLESLGVQSEIHPLSMGEEAARGTDEASWAKDRRVEVRVQ